MTDLVNAFHSLIHHNWKLKQKGGVWLVEENNPGANNTSLQVSAGRSFAFSLDKAGTAPFPFMQPTLKGMHSVCDGIFVSAVSTAPLVMFVELKSSKSGEAQKQIYRSKIFIEWLISLLQFNGHTRETPQYYGVVTLVPRRQVRKGTTSRELPAPDRSKGFPIWELSNRAQINLIDFV